MTPSWKTTTCGVIGAVAAGLVLADFSPLANKIAAFLSAFASSAGLAFARDNNVTSEQVAAAKTKD